jgi:hypothetical protein
VFLVRYEPDTYIPEDGILHSHRRENLKFYTVDLASCTTVLSDMSLVYIRTLDTPFCAIYRFRCRVQCRPIGNRIFSNSDINTEQVSRAVNVLDAPKEATAWNFNEDTAQLC